jgi:RNA polymerase sigma-70 factor (ECF subfamily)
MVEPPQGVANWLPAARDGSLEARGRLLEAYRGYLLLIAEQELSPELRAKGGGSDLVQEAFLKAHRHFDRFQGGTEGELRAWLRRLLLNHLADFRSLYCEAGKRQVGREVALDRGQAVAERSFEPSLPGHEPSPSGVAMDHERRETIRRILDRLPADYRRVLILRHENEMTFEQIGDAMDRSSEAARKLWARAVERFQQEWDPS